MFKLKQEIYNTFLFNMQIKVYNLDLQKTIHTETYVLILYLLGKIFRYDSYARLALYNL